MRLSGNGGGRLGRQQALDGPPPPAITHLSQSAIPPLPTTHTWIRSAAAVRRWYCCITAAISAIWRLSAATAAACRRAWKARTAHWMVTAAACCCCNERRAR